MWGVFAYAALVFGFGSSLHARRAHRVAIAAARAEAALVRAELANISGKLNPHFLFNTLNSLLILTRKDAGRRRAGAVPLLADDALRARHTRSATDRVPLNDELEFVRDYLALESLRLGERLKVDWRIDPATLGDAIPPLTLQPLVENSIVHGIAPQIAGGTVSIESQRRANPDVLALTVRDDGAGCNWPPAAAAKAGGVGLSALRRRFELDFEGSRAARRAVGAGRAASASRSSFPSADSRANEPAPNDRRIMTMRHRTLIAEDEPLAREALSAWVNEMPMLELVGCRADGVSALAGDPRARAGARPDGHPHAGDDRPRGAARPRRRSGDRQAGRHPHHRLRPARDHRLRAARGRLPAQAVSTAIASRRRSAMR